MLIGYTRVSTQSQRLDRQIGALNGAGVDRIFREKASAKSVRDRPQLEKAIDALGPDDVLVIAEWDRATRSMIDGITIIQRVADRGVGVGLVAAMLFVAGLVMMAVAAWRSLTLDAKSETIE